MLLSHGKKTVALRGALGGKLVDQCTVPSAARQIELHWCGSTESKTQRRVALFPVGTEL